MRSTRDPQKKGKRPHGVATPRLKTTDFACIVLFILYDCAVSLTTLSVEVNIYATNGMAKYFHLNTVV